MQATTQFKGPATHPARDRIIADIMRQKDAAKHCRKIADAIAQRRNRQCGA